MYVIEDDQPPIQIPMSDVGLSGFVMAAAGGSDLVASTARDEGWWGFETPLPAVFLRCAQRWPGLILDIGANTGFYSLLGLAAHPDNQSIAFEPDPKVREILQSNRVLNDHGRRLVIEPRALSHETGTATLYVPVQGHGLVESSSSLQRDFKGVHSAEIQVEVSRLDDVIGEDQEVTLVKIDVEGHERNAVQGAEATLRRCRPIVAIELLPDADFEYFAGLVQSLGYVSLSLRASGAILERRIAFDQEGWNHLLVPQEKLDDCRAIFSDLQLPLTEA